MSYLQFAKLFSQRVQYVIYLLVYNHIFYCFAPSNTKGVT